MIYCYLLHIYVYIYYKLLYRIKELIKGGIYVIYKSLIVYKHIMTYILFEYIY